ncbi:MAG TPA: M23 family metallopeptidase [Mycobacteriales bacterium]
MTRGFDPPDTPYGPGHRGVDLAAAPGTPVLAAGPGVVGYVGVLAGRGVVTVVHAAGLRTTYEPVHPVVRHGRHVLAGTVVGTLEAGHVGCPAPACLHWGLLRGRTYLDPLSLLRRGPVRLLPRADPPTRRDGPPRNLSDGATSIPRPDTGTTLRPAVGEPSRPDPNPNLIAAGLAAAGAFAMSRRRPPW